MSVEGFIRLNQDTQAAITDAALVSLLPCYQGLELAYEGFIGLFHKKTNTEGWGYEFSELIKNNVQFPGLLKKNHVEFPGALILGHGISAGCYAKDLWSF